MEADARPAASGVATSGVSRLSSNCGRKARPRLSTMPTSSAPASAPRTDPTPPMTMTTKVVISTRSPMPKSTASNGAAITPARPHSTAPTPNPSLYNLRMSMPSALTISRSSAPARTSMPTRVRFTSHHSPSATSAPMTMKASLATGYSNPGARGTAPCNTAGMSTSGGRRPDRRLDGPLVEQEQQADGLIGEQDQAEGRQHLVEMIALVEPTDHGELDQQAVGARPQQSGHHCRREGPRVRERERCAVGAEHVERTKSQIDHAHDPEYQREAGGQHEQHGPELQPVEQLFEQQRHDGILQLAA